MAETWPGTLPTYVRPQGYSETLPDNLLRSSMDAGPDKVRQRSTAAPRPFAWVIEMDTAQVATFDTFFVTTLNNGALTFNFTMPRTTVLTEVRFTAPPAYQYIGGSEWAVSMELEVLP